MSRKGGNRAYRDHLGKDRSPRHTRHYREREKNFTARGGSLQRRVRLAADDVKTEIPGSGRTAQEIDPAISRVFEPSGKASLSRLKPGKEGEVEATTRTKRMP